MKSILLTSTALVAFAGASFADAHAEDGVDFGASATLGYNTDDDGIGNDGFYWDLSLDVSMSQTLDNGITVSATAGLGGIDNDGVDSDGSEFLNLEDYVLAIESEMAALRFGTVDPVAEANFSAVDGANLGFNDFDVHTGAGFDAILAGEVTMSGVTAMISYGVTADGAGNAVNGNDIDAMQVFASSDFGSVSVQAAYQAEFAEAAMFGLGASTTVSGIDVAASVLSQDGASDIGVSVSAPVGPVTLGAYYSMNDADDAYGLDLSYEDGPIAISADYDMVEGADEGSWEIDANYTVMEGAVIHAGLNSAEDMYLAGTYDLGGGASLLVSYAVDDDNSSEDEVGEDELQIGTTVEVSFSF